MRAKFEVHGPDAEALEVAAREVAERLAGGRHVRSVDLEARPVVIGFGSQIPTLWAAEVEAEIA